MKKGGAKDINWLNQVSWWSEIMTKSYDQKSHNLHKILFHYTNHLFEDIYTDIIILEFGTSI